MQDAPQCKSPLEKLQPQPKKRKFLWRKSPQQEVADIATSTEEALEEEETGNPHCTQHNNKI